MRRLVLDVAFLGKLPLTDMHRMSLEWETAWLIQQAFIPHLAKEYGFQ